MKEQLKKKMQEIVDGCMGDSSPACESSCPMGTNAKEYVGLIGKDKGFEAIDVIRKDLFLPGTLGRICAHPCEKGCRRGDEDSPLAIASLKRYAADNFDFEDRWDITRAEASEKKVAIIGAGPAGAQAAIDLAKSGHSVVIYEKLEVLGGMMRVGIPEYRLPRDIIDREYSLLNKLGVEIKLGVEVGRDITLDELRGSYDATIIAVGKQLGRIDTSLNNSSSKGVFEAATYLKEISLTKNFVGVGKKVAVIGGGDVAMDCARSSLRLEGVEEVYSITLEDSYEAMASSNHEIKGAIAEGINFNLASGIHEITVDSSNRVRGLRLKRCLSILDDSGRFSPKFDENELKDVEVDTLIFAIGQGVDSSFDRDNIIDKNPNGTFKVDPLTMQSSNLEDIFIAGDCARSFVVVEAMAEGRKAAKSINRYLKGRDLHQGRSLKDEGAYETTLYLDNKYLPDGWDSATKIERRSPNELNPNIRIKSFDEVEATLTREQALDESNRCLQCSCKLCMEECIMLGDFTDCPKTLFNDYLENDLENMDPKIAYSCNACYQCTLKCPKDFDMKSTFLDMRPEYINANNGKSPMKGHKAIDAHQFLGYSKVFNTSVPAPKGKKTKYVFFPGCSLPSYNPEAVGKALDHLQETLGGEVGSLLKCCGKPTKALGQKDKFNERFKSVQDELDRLEAEVVIVACQSCMGIFSSSAKQEVVSLWSLLPEIGLPKEQYGKGADSDIVFNIHDSCSTRDRKDLHDGIRWIVNELGYKVEELENSREKTRCCGFGGMVVPANPDVADRVMKRRANETTTGHMISYCAACRQSMESGGADSLHVLDLAFGDTYRGKDQIDRNMGAAKQWINRYKSKVELNKRK